MCLQFDLYLPEGVEFGLWDGELICYADETRFADFKVQIGPNKYKTYSFNTECVRQSDGAYRFIAYNTRNQAIFPGEEEAPNRIFTIKLIASDQASTGEYTAQIKNAIVSNSVDTSSGTATVTGADRKSVV